MLYSLHNPYRLRRRWTTSAILLAARAGISCSVSRFLNSGYNIITCPAYHSCASSSLSTGPRFRPCSLPAIMATDDHSSSRVELYESGLTVPSDSENYSANNEMSSSVQSSSSSPVILYKPPTFWSVVRGAAINLVLPFVNGLMLGFGELFAHEAAFRLGWSNTKVQCCLISPAAYDFKHDANTIDPYVGLPNISTNPCVARA